MKWKRSEYDRQKEEKKHVEAFETMSNVEYLTVFIWLVEPSDKKKGRKRKKSKSFIYI